MEAVRCVAAGMMSAPRALWVAVGLVVSGIRAVGDTAAARSRHQHLLAVRLRPCHRNRCRRRNRGCRAHPPRAPARHAGNHGRHPWSKADQRTACLRGPDLRGRLLSPALRARRHRRDHGAAADRPDRRAADLPRGVAARAAESPVPPSRSGLQAVQSVAALHRADPGRNEPETCEVRGGSSGSVARIRDRSARRGHRWGPGDPHSGRVPSSRGHRGLE